jgi:hypothetical protein
MKTLTGFFYESAGTYPEAVEKVEAVNKLSPLTLQ